MSRYAYVQNNEIKEIHYNLPHNWKNISNFQNLSNYPAELNELGWKIIQPDTTPFDSKLYKIVSAEYELVGSNVVERNILEEIPQVDTFTPTLTSEDAAELERQLKLKAIEDQWSNIRYIRDKAIKDVEWRYDRYYRHERLNIDQIDSIQALDTYVQALADITNQQDPFSITWPILD